MAKTAQGMQGRVPKKDVSFASRILVFYYLLIFVFTHGLA
jgi:hypothetical protein